MVFTEKTLPISQKKCLISAHHAQKNPKNRVKIQLFGYAKEEKNPTTWDGSNQK